MPFFHALEMFAEICSSNIRFLTHLYMSASADLIAESFNIIGFDLIYLSGHMNEFYHPCRHHEIIVCMILSTPIDEHDVRQGDIHKSENACIEGTKQ